MVPKKMPTTRPKAMSKGKFYGVGVGPGDPELLTLKAKRVLESCPVIAVPQTRGRHTLALDIVKGVLDVSQKIILPLNFLMTRERAARVKSYEKETARIAAQLKQGRDVAMITLGDVSIYSTFGYIREIVGGAGYETAAVPGVPSFCAVAALLGTSLTTMQKPLHIIPAGYAGWEGYLGMEGTKVLMKAGGTLPEVKETLRSRGLDKKAALVANCGLPAQKVYKNLEDAGDDEGYFATILIGAPD